jgi:hypothetical protein
MKQEIHRGPTDQELRIFAEEVEIAVTQAIFRKRD